MISATAESLHLDPNSWLGGRIDSGCQEVVLVKDALRFECCPNNGEVLREELVEPLEKERDSIDSLPDFGSALRGDKVEKARVKDLGGDASPSVDVYVARAEDLLLVECKYKALPETQIVKSRESFRECVTRKFDASVEFLNQQGATKLSADRIVLFNADSKEKVLNMFRRIQLEDEDVQELATYHLMDTAEFGERYLLSGVLSPAVA